MEIPSCLPESENLLYLANPSTCKSPSPNFLSSPTNPPNPPPFSPIRPLSSSMSKPSEGKFTIDLEAGTQPELPWAFILKIYGILTVQFLFTITVYSLLVYVQNHPAKHFFFDSSVGIWVYMSIIILFFIVVNLLAFDPRHPINLLLSTLFTVLLSLGLGFSWPYANGRVILESVIITTVLAVSLTIYTFWAARKGHDFGFLLPFLYGFYIVLVVYGVIRLFFPSEKIATMTYEALFIILFSGCIVYHTNNTIKRFPKTNTFGLLLVYGVISAIFVLTISLLGGLGYN